MDQNQELVQRVGNEQLAAVGRGGTFLLLNLSILFRTLRPAGRKTRAKKVQGHPL